MLNLFRKKEATAGKPAADRKPARALTSDPAVSPFLAEHTRGGMTDRFADLNQRRGDWVLLAAGLTVCLLVSLGLNVYQAVRTHLIPFKVVVDGSDGYLLDSGPLEPMDNIEGLYVRRELREVITGLRTVTADRAATRGQFNRAWNRVREESDAYRYLSSYYSKEGNNPMQLRGQRTIVEFVGPTRLEGTDTWTFVWVERSAIAGKGITEDRYRGSMTVEILPVEDIATAEKNPLGVWVTGIEWERVSSQLLDLQDLGGGSPIDLLYPDQRDVRPQTAPIPGATPGGTPGDSPPNVPTQPEPEGAAPAGAAPAQPTP